MICGPESRLTAFLLVERLDHAISGPHRKPTIVVSCVAPLLVSKPREQCMPAERTKLEANWRHQSVHCEMFGKDRNTSLINGIQPGSYVHSPDLVFRA